jgi:hypothetical protein
MKTSKIIVTLEPLAEGQPEIVAEAPFFDVPPPKELEIITQKSEAVFQEDGVKFQIDSYLTDWDTIRIEVFKRRELIAEYAGRAVNCSSSLGLLLGGRYLRAYYISEQ